MRHARLNAGIVAAAVCNANPFRSEGSEPVTALDFIGESSEPTEDEKLEQFKAMFAELAMRQNAGQ